MTVVATGRQYLVAWDAPTGITAQIDVFEITAADDLPVFLKELKIWQTTELGEAQEEEIGVSILKGYTTSGSGGASAAVAKMMNGDAAASFTAECRNTTLATTGTIVKIGGDGWNVRAPYIWTPPADANPPVFQKDNILVVRLDAAPADSITMNATLLVEELG